MCGQESSEMVIDLIGQWLTLFCSEKTMNYNPPGQAGPICTITETLEA